MTSETQNHTLHPQYRADIDGMRAIAVLAVLIFHAFPTLLPGGFVGVDIFFVISGYLISTIIVQNLRNGTFSFIDFYSRRVRRIFPALLLVLLACLLFGWFSLVADEYARLGKHVVAGAGFISNLVLWSESGYFDTVSSTKPLLHLWSLGIEEQFYVLFPLLIWLAYRLKISLRTTALTLGLISFGVNLATVSTNSAAAYYSPAGRFWELLVGTFLAFGVASTTSRKGELSIDTRAALGLLLIALPMMGIDKNSAFPGWWALLPVGGTALLLTAQGSWIERNVLSHRALVSIGLVSYPLYLWHWPLLSFAEILVGEAPPPQYRLLCLVAALFFAWLTYLLIERRYRIKRYRLRQVIFLTASMAVIGYLGFNIMSRDGLAFRHEKLSAPKPENSKSAGFTSFGVLLKKDQTDYSCELLVERSTKKEDTFCKLATPDPYIAVIGDSHSEHLFYGLKSTTATNSNRVLVVGAGGCQPAMRGDLSENCLDQIKANLKLIKRFSSIKYVVLSAYSASIQARRNQDQYDELLKGYLDTVTELQRLGKTVIFNIDIPKFEDDPATCAVNPLPIRNTYRVNSGDMCEEFPISRTMPRDVYDRFVSDLRTRNNTIQFFDSYSMFCNEKSCRIVDDKTLLFRDTNHLTEYGSKLVAEKLQALIR